MKQQKVQQRAVKLHEDTTERTANAPIDLLTPQELAARLRVKMTWVYEVTRTRSGVRNPDPLPTIKMGKFLRFRWSDISAWLDRRSNRRELQAQSMGAAQKGRAA